MTQIEVRNIINKPPLEKHLKADFRDYTSRAVYLPLHIQISVSQSMCPGPARMSPCREAGHTSLTLENRSLPLPGPQTWTRFTRQDSQLLSSFQALVPCKWPGEVYCLWLFGANGTTQPTFALTQWVPIASLGSVILELLGAFCMCKRLFLFFFSKYTELPSAIVKDGLNAVHYAGLG